MVICYANDSYTPTFSFLCSLKKYINIDIIITIFLNSMISSQWRTLAVDQWTPKMKYRTKEMCFFMEISFILISVPIDKLSHTRN